MNTITPAFPNVSLAIDHLLTTEVPPEELQNLPNDLQEIFDFVLDTDYGNSLETRRKMLRIKEITRLLSQTIEPFHNPKFPNDIKKQ